MAEIFPFTSANSASSITSRRSFVLKSDFAKVPDIRPSSTPIRIAPSQFMGQNEYIYIYIFLPFVVFEDDDIDDKNDNEYILATQNIAYL